VTIYIDESGYNYDPGYDEEIKKRKLWWIGWKRLFETTRDLKEKGPSGSNKNVDYYINPAKGLWISQ